MIKINKTVKLSELSQNQEVIANLKGNEIVQVISENATGDHSLKIIMTQEQFVELMSAKSTVALPKEILEKVKIFEAMAKKVAKVMEVVQDDFTGKNKKP